MSDDVLDAAAIQAALTGQLIGHRVLVLEETTSTNDIVYQLADENAEGFVVFAERQTAGRGQHGKRWESISRRGLWFSVLLRPRLGAGDAAPLTAWAAETIAATVRKNYSLGASVVPPNDVYAEGRKVAGVLLEMRALADAPHLGILGIGINLNQTLEEFPEDLRASAGSLAMLTGKNICRHELAVALLRNLNGSYSWRRSN